MSAVRSGVVPGAEAGRRVVVTGIGAVSALGVGWRALENGVFEGRSGVRTRTLFDLAGARSTLSAGVDDGALAAAEPPAEGRSRTDRMAIAAAREALTVAGVAPAATRVGVIVGGSTAGMFETEALLARFEGVLDADSTTRMRTHPLSSTVEAIGATLGPFSRARTVCAACTSSAIAIALGAAWLDEGLVDAVLAGGADALCRLTYSGFGALSVLDPAPARPFREGRAGLALGEGAAFLVLEREADATTRGARALAALAGAALGNEAHHITNPEPGGKTASGILSRALAAAGLEPRDVGYVNAHGTGTPQNDANEALAIRAAFGAHRVAVSSSKGQIGHTLAAAGALEAAITIAALRRAELPPNVPAGAKDPACDVDLVESSRPERIEAAVSSSFGFGGTGASLVFEGAARSGAGSDSAVAQRARIEVARDEVWVTGASAIAPWGVVVWDALAALLDDVSRGGAVVRLPVTDATAALDAARSRRMDRAARLVTTLAEAALRDADGRGARALDRASVAALSSSAYGNVEGCMKFMRRVLDRGAAFASPADFPNLVPSSPVSHAAIYLGLGGPAIATPDHAATAEAAIATAVELLDGGMIDAAVAGSFETVDALAERVLAPLPGVASLRASAEGGSAIVLERRSSALARGAKPLARVRLTDAPSDARSDLAVPVAAAGHLGRGGVSLAAACARTAWRGERLLHVGGGLAFLFEPVMVEG